MSTEGLIQLTELDAILNLEKGTAARYRKLGIFLAVKVHGVWRVSEDHVAYVCDRILRYRAHVPWYPRENLTIGEAAELLQVRPVTVYQMLHNANLEKASNERWTCVTRESVNLVLRRKGRREVA